MLAGVRYKRREVLAHDAVPVWRVLAVEKVFDVLANVLLLDIIFAVQDGVDLLLDIILHVLT